MTSIIGLLVWLMAVLTARPDMEAHGWAALLLQLAALVWVPLIPGLTDLRNRWYVLGAAVVLVLAFQAEQGKWAGLLALPWLMVTFWQFMIGVEMLLLNPRDAGNAARAFGRIFLVVGGLWTFSDRMGWQPLGFDPAIVLLTGVHFHYAGLIFPTLAGLMAQYKPGKLINMACWLALLSIPLTAAGITISQLTGNIVVEALAAAAVALAGWIVALRYGQVAVSEGNLSLVTRIFWLGLSVSLLFSMTLALGYAVRAWFPLEILTIPSMRAWHGTVNAIGVAGCGLLGWAIRSKSLL